MTAHREGAKDVLQLGEAPDEGQPLRTSHEMAAHDEGAKARVYLP